MPVMTEAPGQKKRRYKMRIINDEYMSEYDGWNPAGSVIVVDEDTAVRWLENHIAVQAGKDEQTAKEIRRAELLASLEAVDDDDEPAPIRRPVGRPRKPAPPPVKQPIGRPKQRARAAVPPELVGAGVINSLNDSPDDDDGGEDDE